MATQPENENRRESGARVPKSGKSRRPDPIHTGDRGDEPKEPYGLTESMEDRGGATRHHDGVQPPAASGIISPYE